MVHMPGEVKGKSWKSRPFHGPYHVLLLTPTNAEVRLVDCPTSESIFVALNRVCVCYDEMPYWILLHFLCLCRVWDNSFLANNVTQIWHFFSDKQTLL